MVREGKGDLRYSVVWRAAQLASSAVPRVHFKAVLRSTGLQSGNQKVTTINCLWLDANSESMDEVVVKIHNFHIIAFNFYENLMEFGLLSG